MSVIQLGDVYWADVPQGHTVGSEQYKRRPYVIVSRTSINKVRNTVVGIPLSTKTEKKSQHNILIPRERIITDPSFKDTLADSVALSEQIRVLAVERLKTKIGRLDQSAVLAIQLGLTFLFEIR